MSFDPFRAYTQARIGLGHFAPALPTKAWLQFAYHHACATDAVRAPWDIHVHAKDLSRLGLNTVILQTQIADRDEYLMRPDLGRLLLDTSVNDLHKNSWRDDQIVIVVSNGLSSLAVTHHLTPLLSNLRECFHAANLPALKNIILVANARVGLIDHVGELLKPTIGIVIIGERPGLSSPDSLAIYLTYRPRSGLTDAMRNCVSNIRPPSGLSYEQAAHKTCFLIKHALVRKLSGVHLKEETDRLT